MCCDAVWCFSPCPLSGGGVDSAFISQHAAMWCFHLVPCPGSRAGGSVLISQHIQEGLSMDTDDVINLSMNNDTANRFQ